MNRKDRLKITSTPDKKLNYYNIYQQNSILEEINTSNNQVEYNDIDYVDVVDDSLFTSPDSLIRIIFNYSKVVLSYLKYIVPYGIVVYFIIFYFYNRITIPIYDTEISELTKEIDNLKQANASLSISTLQVPVNLCKIEHCTTVQVNNADLYYYGLLGMRKSVDPYVIFSENILPGECLVLLPNERMFTIKFAKEVIIDNFNIFHPDTKNKQSAIKDFILYGSKKSNIFEIGSFSYDTSKSNHQTFNFKEITTDRIIIKVLNNNGHKLYTTVYKIYINGIFK